MDASSAALAVAVVRSKAAHSLLRLLTFPLRGNPSVAPACSASGTGQVAHQGHDLPWSMPMHRIVFPGESVGIHSLEPGCESTPVLHLLFRQIKTGV